MPPLDFLPANKARLRFHDWYDGLPNFRDQHGFKLGLYDQPDIARLATLGFQWAVVAFWHRSLKAATNGLTSGEDIIRACGVRAFRFIKPELDRWAEKIRLHAFSTPSTFHHDVYRWYHALPRGGQVAPPPDRKQSYMNHTDLWSWIDDGGSRRHLVDSGKIVFYAQYIDPKLNPRNYYDSMGLPNQLSFQRAEENMRIWLANIPYGAFA